MPPVVNHPHGTNRVGISGRPPLNRPPICGWVGGVRIKKSWRKLIHIGYSYETFKHFGSWVLRVVRSWWGELLVSFMVFMSQGPAPNIVVWNYRVAFFEHAYHLLLAVSLHGSNSRTWSHFGVLRLKLFMCEKLVARRLNYRYWHPPRILGI